MLSRTTITIVVCLLLFAFDLASGGCSEGFFSCRNHSDICLPQREWCDGKLHCPDFSDELNCVDLHGASYYDNLFRKNPHAEHDDFDPSCLLQRVGDGCECRHRDVLCHHTNFTRAPVWLSAQSIDILDLTGNHFKEINNATLATLADSNVETLVLKHCGIATIRSLAFGALRTLQKLHLDNNGIRRLFDGDEVFHMDNELEFLSLRYNRISDIRTPAFRHLHGLLELDLSYNRLAYVNRTMLAPLARLMILNLQGNLLQAISCETFPVALPLRTLSLSDNQIDSIGDDSLAHFGLLQNLYLSANKLRTLGNGTLIGVKNLLALTLDDNRLDTIDAATFTNCCTNLISLSMRRNPITKLERTVLGRLLALEHVYFDKFEMCVDAPHVRDCNPKGDGISSREHLLDNVTLRASVWIMALIGCLGNVLVLIGRCLTASSNNVVHSLYIANLALSDLFMGIYLFIIGIVDNHYRGSYLINEWRWRHSIVCTLSGFLNTLSCESSIFILSLVTWDRFVSVTQPLARRQPSAQTAKITLLILWTIAIIIAGLPVLPFMRGYFGRAFYNSNGVCLPLYLHNPYAMGWEYSLILFMCCNALALLFISYAYLRMIREIRISGVAIRSTRQQDERDRVAQRFGVIVLTDCLCWVPIIIVKLVALAGVEFSDSYKSVIYATLAIYVMPINSALNPVLYTLTTTLFQKQLRKLFGGRLCAKATTRTTKASDYSGCDSLSFGERRALTFKRTQSSLTTAASKNSWKRSTLV